MKKPRRWGLGIGLLLLVMLAFHTYLWNQTTKDPEAIAAGFDLSFSYYVIYELPHAIAAALCMALKWHGPTEAVDAKLDVA